MMAIPTSCCAPTRMKKVKYAGTSTFGSAKIHPLMNKVPLPTRLSSSMYIFCAGIYNFRTCSVHFPCNTEKYKVLKVACSSATLSNPSPLWAVALNPVSTRLNPKNTSLACSNWRARPRVTCHKLNVVLILPCSSLLSSSLVWCLFEPRWRVCFGRWFEDCCLERFQISPQWKGTL